MTSTAIVAYLLLFASVAFLFVLACLLLGKLLRPAVPTAQKVETYECGEPAIGPGYGQFDLRFYVVALLFLIFEVEVAFFFPPATVFGKATHLLADRSHSCQRVILSPAEDPGSGPCHPDPTCPCPQETCRNVDGDGGGVRNKPLVSDGGWPQTPPPSPSSARTLARAAMLDLGVFFAVLLVGFAYIWRCGDLNWVRAIGHPRSAAEDAAMLRQLRSDNWP